MVSIFEKRVVNAESKTDALAKRQREHESSKTRKEHMMGEFVMSRNKHIRK
jgi:hypothetical protein